MASGTFNHMPGPGDPNYVSMDEHVQRELAFNAAWEARPEVIAKRKADAESRARVAPDRKAKGKRPKLVHSTDCPWLKPDWIEAPVRPFKRR